MFALLPFHLLVRRAVQGRDQPRLRPRASAREARRPEDAGPGRAADPAPRRPAWDPPAHWLS